MAYFANIFELKFSVKDKPLIITVFFIFSRDKKYVLYINTLYLFRR